MLILILIQIIGKFSSDIINPSIILFALEESRAITTIQ